jgi:hypothetical protein
MQKAKTWWTAGDFQITCPPSGGRLVLPLDFLPDVAFTHFVPAKQRSFVNLTMERLKDCLSYKGAFAGYP